MKIKLRIEKAGVVLHEQSCDISDAESFGKACARAWSQVRDQRLQRTTSIGSLMDQLNDRLIEDFDGARFSLTRT